MKAITKTEISKKTSTDKCFGLYTCQLEVFKNYTSEYISGKIFKNVGNSSFDTGYTVRTKKEFIEAVYRLERK